MPLTKETQKIERDSKRSRHVLVDSDNRLIKTVAVVDADGEQTGTTANPVFVQDNRQFLEGNDKLLSEILIELRIHSLYLQEQQGISFTEKDVRI